LRIPFKLGEPFLEFKQRFNIAPGQTAPVIVAKEDGNTLEMFRWGLIPSWAREAAIGLQDDRRPRRVHHGKSEFQGSPRQTPLSCPCQQFLRVAQ
jgi:putative SOS response-associated peptidase YedK